ncbi:MAG: C39 family peptidase [Oscillospiraceae bacterium]|nr:C39 family peptidase [Oscillospiraceae bacterium]MBQ9930518.1 C39 family peptidase [Oscillospiraceae bacterium]
MRRSVFDRIIATVILLVVLAGTPLRVSAIPTSYELNFPIVQQQNGSWCWAACGSAVANYYGWSISQGQFVYDLRGNLLEQGGSLNDIKNGLMNYSIRSTFLEGVMTLSQISSRTYSAREPIVAAWFWRAGGGHAVVITGYINSAALGGQCVVYMDPWYGRIHTKDYAEFVGSGEHTWGGSLVNVQEI